MNSQHESVKKWGKEPLSRGFTIFPNLILDVQDELKLDLYEIYILLTASRFMNADKEASFSIKTIAEKCRVRDTTVRRRVRSLEDKGLIKRKFRKGQTNIYSLIPLCGKLTIHGRKYMHGRSPPSSPVHTPPYAIEHTNKNSYKNINKRTESVGEIMKRNRYVFSNKT